MVQKILAQATNNIQYPSNSGTLGNLNNMDLGKLVGGILPTVYVLAGISLLLMLIYGGISLMTAGGDQNKTAQGYGIITNAMIGFLIVFVSYLVVQIVEVALGVKIL